MPSHPHQHLELGCHQPWFIHEWGKLRLCGLAWFAWIHPSLNLNPVIPDANAYILSAVSPCLGPVPWLTSSRTYLHILKFQTSIRTNFLKVNCPEPAVVYFQGVNIDLQSRLLPTSFLLLKIIYNGIFLRLKKKHTWVSSSKVNEPRALSQFQWSGWTYTEWSKSEREKQILYINS